jgi:hypothetical protein
MKTFIVSSNSVIREGTKGEGLYSGRMIKYICSLRGGCKLNRLHLRPNRRLEVIFR